MPRVYMFSNVLMAVPTSVPAKVSAVDMVSLVVSRTGGKASAIIQTSRRSTRNSKAGHYMHQYQCNNNAIIQLL